MKDSKQSVEALKKARSENVSESKQSHVEKPDIINTLEISEERDNENTLLTLSNCDGDHQPPLSKQKHLKFQAGVNLKNTCYFTCYSTCYFT